MGTSDRLTQILAQEIEEGLREIDFEEVTTEDRITFVEAVVAWQVRWVLGLGRFDVALRLRRYATERIARIYEEREDRSEPVGSALPRFPGR